MDWSSRETEAEQLLTGSERMYARIATLTDLAAITKDVEAAFARYTDKYELLTSEKYSGEELHFTVRKR